MRTVWNRTTSQWVILFLCRKTYIVLYGGNVNSVWTPHTFYYRFVTCWKYVHVQVTLDTSCQVHGPRDIHLESTCIWHTQWHFFSSAVQSSTHRPLIKSLTSTLCTHSMVPLNTLPHALNRLCPNKTWLSLKAYSRVPLSHTTWTFHTCRCTLAVHPHTFVS